MKTFKPLVLGFLLFLPFLLPTAGLSQPFAYVANRFSDNVSVIDTSTNTVIDTVAVGDLPNGVAITPDGTRAYVTNFVDNTVSVIDTSDNTVIATVAVGVGPNHPAVTPDGTRVYVPNGTSDTASVIDTSTNTVIATVAGVGDARDVVITPDGTMAYLSRTDSSAVSVINTSTNTMIATVDVGGRSIGIAITPDGALAYVPVRVGDKGVVAVIDTDPASSDFHSVIATVEVADLLGGNLTRVAITPDGTRAYVVNNNSNSVHVINIADNTLIATLSAVAADPNSIAITPDGTRAYVTSTFEVAKVIDTDPASSFFHTVIATVALGDGPSGVAITPAITSITGTVTYTDSQTGPIRIIAESADMNREWRGEATIDSPGSFTIDNVPEGRYFVMAFRDSDDNHDYTDGEAYGYYQDASGLLVVTVTSGTTVSGVDIDLSDPLATPTGVSVNITSNLTDIIRGYLILFRAGDLPQLFSEEIFETSLEPVAALNIDVIPGTHSYQVISRWGGDEVPLPAGTYDFYFMTGNLDDGPDNGVVHGFQQNVSVTRGFVTNIPTSFTLNEGATVTGQVTNDNSGNPIWKAFVTLEANGITVAFAQTDQTGYYRFDHVPVGTYTLRVAYNGYNEYTDTVNVSTDGQSPITANAPLTASQTLGAISGTVTASGGAVITNPTRVVLKDGDEPVAIVISSATNGSYTISDVVPGSYNLVASARGYVPQQVQITVNTGQSITRDFALNDLHDSLVNGVNWLLAQQNADGSFGPPDQFIFGWSGFAALALLSIKDNPDLNLEQGLLDQIQNALDDSICTDGAFGVKQYFLSTYHDADDPNTPWNDVGAFCDDSTSWAVIAATPVALERLIALGLPIDDSMVTASVNFLKNAQLTASDPIFIGGWRYNPHDTDADNWETPWVIMALMKAGLSSTESHVTAGLDFIKRSQITAGENTGTFKYMPSDGDWYSSGATAACMVALNFAGLPRTDPYVDRFFQWAESHPWEIHHSWGEAEDSYYWSMLAWAASLYEDDIDFTKTEYDTLELIWNIADYVLLAQNADGSWDNPDPTTEGSRSANSVMFTASALMALAPNAAPLAPPEKAMVSGHIYNHTGQPLQDARVEALLGGNVIDSDTTDADGLYELSVPINYNYTIMVSAAGYARKSITTVEVTGDLSGQNISFTSEDIDNTAPTISSLTPANNDTVFEPKPEISAVLSDDHAGIDPDTICLS